MNINDNTELNENKSQLFRRVIFVPSYLILLTNLFFIVNYLKNPILLSNSFHNNLNVICSIEYELCRKFQIYIAAYFTTKSLYRNFSSGNAKILAFIVGRLINFAHGSFLRSLYYPIEERTIDQLTKF